MDKQEAIWIVRAIETGIRMGGADSEHKQLASEFRQLRTVLFECFKSEYKPGVNIFLNYLNYSKVSFAELTAAVAMLGNFRKSEIITHARRLYLLTGTRPEI